MADNFYEFNNMYCESVGKEFPSREKSYKVRSAINRAIKQRGYRMRTVVRGKMLYVVKDSDPDE